MTSTDRDQAADHRPVHAALTLTVSGDTHDVHLSLHGWRSLLRSFGSGGGTFFVATTVVVNITNFVFHLILSRLLGPSSYGALGALLNVTSVLAVPLTAIQASVAYGVARRRDDEVQPALGRLLSVAGCFALALAVLWWAAAGSIDGYFHLQSPGAALTLGVWMVPAVLSSVLEGVLIGQRRFRSAGLGYLVGNGIGRLVVGVGLVVLGLGVTGGILATVVASATTLMIYAAALRPRLRGADQLRPNPRDALLTTASFGGIALLIGIDAWLARHFLPAESAGLFTAAATAGNIVLFLPAAITMVAFPRLAAASGRGREAGAVFLRSTAAVASVGLIGALAMSLLSSLFVAVLFGSQFAQAAKVIGVVAFADAFIGIAMCFVYLQVARRSRLALAAWPACLLAYLLAAQYHGSARAVAFDMFGATAALLAMLAVTSLSGAIGLSEATDQDQASPVMARLYKISKVAGNPATWVAVGCAATIALGPLSVKERWNGWAGHFAAVGFCCFGLAVAMVIARLQASRQAAGELLDVTGGTVPITADQRRWRRQLTPRMASVLIPVGAAMLAVQTWFRSGGAIGGGDLAPPGGTALAHHLFTPWFWSGANLGGPGTNEQQLPWAALLAVVHAVGGAGPMAQRLWLTGLLGLVALGAALLLNSVGLSPLPCAVGALIYTFNPYTVAMAGDNYVFLTAMGLTPLLAAWVVAASKGRPMPRLLLGLVPISVLLGVAAENPPLLLACAAGAGGGIVLVRVLDGRAASVLALRRAGLAVGLVAVLSAYWWVPFVLYVHGTPGVGTNTQSSWTAFEGRATLANGFWLNNMWAWKYPTSFPYAGAYDDFPLATLKYLIPFTAFAALGVSSKLHGVGGRRLLRLLAASSIVALFSVLLSTGTHFPGSIVFNRLYDLPFGWLLQEPGRFLLLAALAYSVMIAIACEQLPISKWCAGAKRYLRPQVRHLSVCAVVLGALISVGFPLFTGDVVTAAASPYPSDHTAIPGYWSSMSDLMNGEHTAGAVMMLPVDDFYQMPYTWYYGNDGFITNLLVRHVIDPVGQGYASSSDELLAAAGQLQQAILTGNWTEASALANALGIRSFLVRGDINPAFPGRTIASPAQLADALRTDPDASQVATRGPLHLFDVKGPAAVPDHFVTVGTGRPNLGLLSVLPGRTAFVNSSPVPGLAAVTTVPPLANWTLGDGSLTWQTDLPPGRRLDSVIAGTSLAAYPTTGFGVVAGSGGRAMLSALLGTNQVLSADPSTAPWGPPDGCQQPSAPGNLMPTSIDPLGGPKGTPSVTLRATSEPECETLPVALPSHDLIVSIASRHVSGAPPRVCLLETSGAGGVGGNPGSCAAFPDLPDGSGWSVTTASVTVPASVTSLALSLHADAQPSGVTVNEYAAPRVFVSPAGVPSDQPLAVVTSGPATEAHPQVLVDQTGYSADWTDGTSSEHVMVNGLFNGWLNTRGGQGIAHYRYSAWPTAAALVSAGSLLVLAGALLVVRRRRKAVRQP